MKFDENLKNRDYNFKRNLIAYTIDNNLFVSDNEIVKQVNENEENITFGQVVHRYEFGITKGTFWSPNGNKLAFYKNDEKNVDEYPLLIISDTTTKINQIKYPMSGDLSEVVNIGIYDVDTEKVKYLQIDNVKDYYLTNICWGPSEKYIYVSVLNRIKII